MEILRTNPENRLEEKKSYIQGLFFSGSELFTRNPQPCEEVPGANMVTSFVSDLDEEIRTAEETDENILSLKNKLEDQGYHCNIKILAQFLLGLNTNQLIILHGAPGMGEDSLMPVLKNGGVCILTPAISDSDMPSYYNGFEIDKKYETFLELLQEGKVNRDYRGCEILDSREYSCKLKEAICGEDGRESKYEYRIASTKFLPGNDRGFYKLFYEAF